MNNIFMEPIFVKIHMVAIHIKEMKFVFFRQNFHSNPIFLK